MILEQQKKAPVKSAILIGYNQFNYLIIKYFDAKYNYAWKWEIYDFMVQMWYKCAVFNNKQPQENHYKNKDKDSFWYACLFLP